MAYRSTPDDLALHGVRVLGFEASGWVRHSSFAGTSGWSTTGGGRAENETRLAAELDLVGARDAVVAAHAAFLPLNERLGKACTDWQVRPTRLDPLAFNDHTDWRWDERVLGSLAYLDGSFRTLCDQLSDDLARFDGYADLYSAALRKANAGHRAWVDASDRDSCHLVWMQFHEDLLATLGIPRGSDT